MTTEKELSQRICEAQIEVEKAVDAKRYYARNGRKVAQAISLMLDDINEGIECKADKDRVEELSSDLAMCVAKLFDWREEEAKRQALLEDLRRARSASQEDGAAYGYDAKGNRGCLAASPSRLKLEEVTSDQELEQAARQAIRAEQIYQQVADEMKAAQSTSEASCSDSSALQQ